MSTVQEITQAVSHLPKDELNRFRDWFDEFENAEWDKQIEMDVASGKLDKLASQALKDFRKGNYREL